MNESTKIGLQDLLRAGHIKRWHICNTQKEQTLADHSYMVTTIALHLYQAVVPSTTNFTEGTEDRHLELAVIAMAALYHDAVEIRTGDMPTPGKRLIKHMSNSKLFDDIDNAIMPDLPFIRIERNDPFVTNLTDFVKMADAIDAATWIRENGVGPRAAEVADKCWGDMEKLVIDFEMESAVAWRDAVNEVLAALLCPRLRSSLS